jgi:hypothetical protein
MSLLIPVYMALQPRRQPSSYKQLFHRLIETVKHDIIRGQQCFRSEHVVIFEEEMVKGVQG